MKNYTIRRNRKANVTTYESPLFSMSIAKHQQFKNQEILVIFSNHVDAAAVFVSREQATDLLKRKFKKGLDLQKQNA